MASTLKFVDSIASNPTTRLDLNDRTTWRLHVEGTAFPPPPLNRAIASTLLADGATIPASAYGLRTLTLQLSIGAASADATATQLQTLFRELNRPTNILRWHQETTEPVFFRAFRTSADEVQDLGRIEGKRKLLSVDVLAEPFALGLREDPIVLATLDTNPANANGCFLDVTGVKGDVEAPAYIRWPTSAITAIGSQSLFAIRRRGTPSAAPFLFQAESLTQGTNTTTQPNDANFSGAGNNYSRCTFTTATMQDRLFTLDLGTAGVDLRGKYRVFLRFRKNGITDAINLQLRWGGVGGSVQIDNTAYVTPGTTNILTADLGEVSIPVGQDPMTDPSGVEVAVSDAFFFALRAERTSGAGTIDFDFLLFVPADDRLALVKWNDPGTDHWLLDARDNTASARNSSSQVASAGAASIAGGFPMLTPNQTNRIYMLREIQNPISWTLTTVPNVSISYWPRYLSVRPAST